jgi:hypothetical protein
MPMYWKFTHTFCNSFQTRLSFYSQVPIWENVTCEWHESHVKSGNPSQSEWPDEFWKIAQNAVQPIFLSKWTHSLKSGKSSTKMRSTFVIFIKQPKVSSHPIGRKFLVTQLVENSYNLVALVTLLRLLPHPLQAKSQWIVGEKCISVLC